MHIVDITYSYVEGLIFTFTKFFLGYFGLINTNLDTLLYTGDKSQGTLHFKTICSYSPNIGLRSK